MTGDKVESKFLASKLNRKLSLVEIETQLIKISYNLIDDEVYTIDDAVYELIEVIKLIEIERQVVMMDIKKKMNTEV